MTAEQSTGGPTPAAEQSSPRHDPRMVYFWAVHTPVTITSVVLALVVHNGLLPWLAVVLGITWLLLLVQVAALAGRLASESNAIHAAMDKVPRPRRCDRCGEVEPDVCPKPWVGTCPLRSIETGQTYKDFLGKSRKGSAP